MSERTRDLIFVGVLIGLAVLGIAVMIVMVVTGYVPVDGFGRSSAHAQRFGMTAGITAGLVWAGAIWVLTR